MAFCQARSDTNGDGRVQTQVGPQGEIVGDQLESYLAIGNGGELGLEELLAYGSDGRFLAIRRGSELTLVDAHSGVDTTLGASAVDLRSVAGPFGNHRTVRFDPSGTRLLYVQQAAGASKVIVRDLVQRTEVAIDPGPGQVFRAGFDMTGHWVVLDMLTNDTNKSGQLEWPAPGRPARATRHDSCFGAIPRYPVWVRQGDDPSVWLAPASGGSAEPAPGFITATNDGFVARDALGRTIWNKRPPGRNPNGLADAGALSALPTALFASATTYEVASSKCDGRIIHVDAERDLMLVGCAGPGSRWPLSLVGKAYRNELGIDVAPMDTLRPCEAKPRLIPLYPGKSAVLLDLELRQLVTLKDGDFVLCTHGSKALIARAGKLVLFDAASRLEASLAGALAEVPLVLQQAPSVFVTPFAVDVAKGEIEGYLPPEARPFALTRDGHVLVAESQGTRRAADLPQGPLRWRALRPLPSSGAIASWRLGK